MDINLLVINVGNSRVALGAFKAGELTKARRSDLSDRANLEGVIGEMWKEIAAGEQPAVAGASVNPPMVEVIEQAVMQATGKKVQWVGKDLDLPMEVRTENPQETGVDRILNVAAAYEQMEKSCCVVDAGTAITIDVCDDKGRFLGGSIAPGARMQLEAMHANTAKLPEVALKAPEGAFGTSTQQAMLHGVFYGVRGMVKEMVENYATELGTWPDLIATGGDAHVLFDQWELVHAIAPDLTLYGIALAYSNHHIKHGT